MSLRALHVLRKLDPSEWGGTETALQHLFEGLGRLGVGVVAYCPRLKRKAVPEPLASPNCQVRRFRSFIPVFGLSKERRRQMTALGGNLMSLDLVVSLWREQPASIIHTHTLGRLGGVARAVARRRGLPLVVSIHGGLMDLPEAVREGFHQPSGGWEWGRAFGWLLRCRRLLLDADAIVTCNEQEATLLREALPSRRVVVMPHGIPMKLYETNHRAAAEGAFPEIRGRELLLCAGRVDPIKNQSWLLEQGPAIFERHPNTVLVLAGACTDEPYGKRIRQQIEALGLSQRVLLTGGLPSADPRLIGLFQSARAVILPSRSETFGLVILEAWAAGTPVLASRTSGPASLIRQGENGWLFDLENPGAFHAALGRTLGEPGLAREMAARGSLVSRRHSLEAVAGRLNGLYEELVGEGLCVT